MTTRAAQWLLCGASSEYENIYCYITAADGEGYDFYIAYSLDDDTIADLFDREKTGADIVDELGLEVISIPGGDYAVFETERVKRPIGEYFDLRNKIGDGSADPGVDFGTELVTMHWRTGDENGKYIGIAFPLIDERRHIIK